VGYRALFQNLRTIYKLPHLTEELTKQLPLKDRKKTGETKTELLFKYQHQDWMVNE
jgi:hypothetical protein